VRSFAPILERVRAG